MDSTVIVWQLTDDSNGGLRGKPVQQLRDHTRFVQGVAWHPAGHQIATQSCDGSVRIYPAATKKGTFSNPITVNKLLITASTEIERAKYSRLFVDDLKSVFFRRLAFSPDGLLLITPAGYNHLGSPDKTNGTATQLQSPGTNCCYVFRVVDPSRFDLTMSWRS